MLEALKTKTYNLLRWSEKYTRTDMVYLAKGGGWLSYGRFISMASAFLLSIAFANFLPKEVYGNYKYVISIITVLSMFTLSGMNTAISRAAALGNDGNINLAIRTQMRWGLLGSAISIGLAVYYFLQSNNTFAIIFTISCFFIPFINIYNLYSGLLQGLRRFKELVRYDIFFHAIYAAPLIVLIFLTDNVFLLVLPFLISNTFIQGLVFNRVKKKINLPSSVSKESVEYGMHLSFMNGLLHFASVVDQILVFYFLGPIQLAVYNIALAPTHQLKGVFQMVIPLAMPKLAIQNKHEIKKTIFRKAFIYTLAVSFFVFLYIVVAPYIFKILFPQYNESIVYTQLLALTLIFSAIALFLTVLQAQMAQKVLYKITLVNSLVEIILLSVLASMYGIMGVVVGRFISRLFNTIYLALMVKRM